MENASDGAKKLGQGWLRFASYYGIEEGCTVLFWLISRGEFAVQLFGIDGALTASSLPTDKRKPPADRRTIIDVSSDISGASCNKKISMGSCFGSM